MVFEVGGKRGEIQITPSMGSFSYRCVFESEEVKEDNEIVSSSASEPSPELQIFVPSAVVGVSDEGKRLVYYQIKTAQPTLGRTNSVHRRFRDILSAYEAIQSAYKGSQLAATIPSPPSRSFSMFVDHFAPHFIEERRDKLQSFLRSLAGVPRALDNSDLQGILGLSSNAIRETSVMFASGALGMKLSPKQGNSVVTEFVAVGGAAGPAESSGRVGIGDLISKVNGVDVIGEDHTVITARLRSAGRPLVVHFIGYFGGEAEAAKAEAAATEAPAAPAASSGGAMFTGSVSPAPAPAAAAAAAASSSGFVAEADDPFGVGSSGAWAAGGAGGGADASGGMFGTEATDDPFGVGSGDDL
jgi:hypothetical protein